MKNFVLGAISALVLVGVAYAAFSVVPQLMQNRQKPLYDRDVQGAREAVLCDGEKHVCNYYEKTQSAGNVRVVIASQGRAVEGLEVDLGSKPGAIRYYVKLTDRDGIALFQNIPVGTYILYFNGNSFPQGYENPPTVPVEITQGQTAERNIELAPKR